MSTSAFFTKKSTKRYKALRRITNDIVAPEGWYIIPGRERGAHGPSSTVYVQVGYKRPGMNGHVSHYWRRFYFVSKPKPREVRQVVKLMLEVMRNQRSEREDHEDLQLTRGTW